MSRWSTWQAKIQTILQQANVSCCVVSRAGLELVTEAKRAGAPVDSVVLLDERPEDATLVEAAEAAGLIVVKYAEVVLKGAVLKQTHTGFGFGADSAAHLDEEDDDNEIYTLMYSSGSSGDPKAVATPKSSWRKVSSHHPTSS